MLMKKVVLIGAGNVATSMAIALSGKCDIAQIFSRKIENAKQLAAKVDCTAVTDNLDDIIPDGDVYIISVKDDAIADVIHRTTPTDGLWVHTSGTKPISMFPGYRKHYGVLYPMQSFSKQLPVDFNDVHIFIEGNTRETTQEIKDFASLLSPHVAAANSDTRRKLHIAAVFACNFANHMWTLADELLTDANMPFDAIKPLIKSSVDKLNYLSPIESQTGPAARDDYEVIQKHLSMLSGDKHEIYEIITKSIIKSQRKPKENK